MQVRNYFEKINADTWHARGIHWIIHHKLAWIQIILNYDPEVGV
jgi:hypothetical protein